MKDFFYSISLKYYILTAYIVIIFVFAGIGISQYNVLIKINKIKGEKEVLNKTKFNFFKIQYLFVEELELLQEIKMTENNDKINKIKNKHIENKKNFEEILLETEQFLNYETENDDLNKFFKQLRDTLSNINTRYYDINFSTINAVIKYKGYLNNPSKIRDNYQQLIQEESELNKNYNLFFRDTSKTVQMMVKDLNDAYILVIEHNSQFIETNSKLLNLSLLKLDNSFNEIINSEQYNIQKISNKSIRNSWILFSIGFIFALILSILISRMIVNPINLLKNLTNKIARGELPDSKLKKSGNEIGEMNSAIEALLFGLKNTSNFAYEIGKGNFQHKFTPLSAKDVLGNSLLDMRQSLQLAQREEEKRQVDDQRRNWTTEGLTKFAEILRHHPENLKELSNEIIINIVKYLNANQGGIFILNDTDKYDVYLELLAAYAYNRKKYINKKIKLGEGLIGGVAVEKFSIYMTDVPNEYIEIESGTGKTNPTSILIVPLKIEEQVLGVIEIASFYKIKEYERNLVEKIAESIASTLSTARINTQTATLLEKSQVQAQEMKNQEEAMKQTIGGLREIQEKSIEKEEQLDLELSKITGRFKKIQNDNEKLLEKRKYLEKEYIKNITIIEEQNTRQRDLLKTIGDGVIIFNEKGNIIFANNAAEKIWEYKESELIGRKIEELFLISKDEDSKLFNEKIIAELSKSKHPKKYEILRKDKSSDKYLISLLDENKDQTNTNTIFIKDEYGTEAIKEKSKIQKEKLLQEFNYITKLELYENTLINKGISLPKEKYPKQLIRNEAVLKIGLSIIDMQHSKLIELINKLYKSHIINENEKEFIEIGAKLIDYIEYHFGFEEKYMKDSKYEKYEAHKKIHDDFISNIKSLYEKYKLGELDAVYALFVNLSAWTVNHIKIKDLDYADTLKKYGLS